VGDVRLEARGDVRVLHLGEDENRFNRTSIDAIHAALDEVEAIDGPVALVTAGTGKFFSNGLDLDWLASDGDAGGFVEDVHRVFGRIMALDRYAVAAVNGHAFAGGAMLARAHDLVVMREDRGFWCLPEVDLGLPLTPAMYATVATHVPTAAMAEASLTGRRYTATEAQAAGIVDEVAAEGAVLDVAVERAAAMAGRSREVVGAHKALLHGEAARTCGVAPRR
jgi:enoyl-CoA hydratase/carnithine racemase